MEHYTFTEADSYIKHWDEARAEQFPSAWADAWEAGFEDQSNAHAMNERDWEFPVLTKLEDDGAAFAYAQGASADSLSRGGTQVRNPYTVHSSPSPKPPPA